MTNPRDLIIDVDTHITEPADVWTSRVPAKWKDAVPRVEWDGEAKEEAWFLGDKKLSSVGGWSAAGWPEKFPAHPSSYAEALPATYDATARLKHMDETGVYAEVLYPNVAGFGSQRFLELRDPELMLACVRAYNDFQLDWISPDPKRFIPIMATPFWDVAAAVKEVERCAALGHKGVLFTATPQDFGLPILGNPHWDPLWSIAQEAELPVSFHIGSGDLGEVFTEERIRVEGFGAAYARTSCNLFLQNGMQLADLLLSGVLARFPELKFVSIEGGIGWIPFLLEAVDYSFNQAGVRGERPFFDMMPSDYFRRQVYSCYWFEKVAPERLLDLIGVDRIMFETDFPHPTCLYDDVQETVEAGLGSQPEDVRRRILFDNAADLYKVEVN